MFGIGMPELLLIMAVALIVIGPKKLPDLAKSLGKALGEFKRATNDLKQSIEKDTGLDEVRQNLRETGQEMRRSFNTVDALPAAAVSDSKAGETKGSGPADGGAADAADTLAGADATPVDAAKEKSAQ